MTEKQLKNLSRLDLLELLLEQTKYVDALEKELNVVRSKLKSAEQNLGSSSGMMGGSSFLANGAFDAADQTARQIVDRAEKYEQQVHAECDMLYAETRERCMDMLRKTYAHCDELVRDAETKAAADPAFAETSFQQPPVIESNMRPYQDYYCY